MVFIRNNMFALAAQTLALVPCFCLLPSADLMAAGSGPSACQIRVSAVSQPPTLDGVLSRNEWRNAAMVSSFTQKEPVEGDPASEPTFVLVCYDRNNLYLGIRCFDRKPGKIVANEMRRDYDLAENDFFEIIIDTYHDHRNSYYFATNPLGARRDSEVKAEGKYINWDWDGLWSSVAKIDSLGWTAEVAIPFKSLRFEKSGTLTWGINFARYIARKRESDYWAPISRDDDFDTIGKFKPSKFGVLRGLADIAQESRLQVKPAAVGGLQRELNSGKFDNTHLSEIGLDAKLHITPNMTSDVTVNPDFAQVEADQEQVNLSRFSLFFPEKREFFVEGLDVFTVGEGETSNPFVLLFHSRRIGLNPLTRQGIQILGGAKLTGKEGPYEVGLLEVYTNDDAASKVPETNFSALRVKRDILKRSAIGAMALSKDRRGGGYNRTYAVDADFSFDNNLNFGGYVAKTSTPGLKGKDTNTFLKASWGTDKYFGFGSFTDIGANFNPEMGFLQWIDVRKYLLSLGYNPRPHFMNIRQTHFLYDMELITDHDNTLQYRTVSPGIFTVFNDESFLFLGVTNYYDNAPTFQFGKPEAPAVVTAGVYKYNVAGLSYGSDQSRTVSARLKIGAGTFYSGTFLGGTLSGAWRPDDKFGLDLFWQWNRIDLPVPNGRFGGHLVDAVVKYSFTNKLFLNADVQWNQLDHIFTNKILLNYIHSPGSDLYLVYSDLWNTRGTLQANNRTLAAKFTYLFDF